MTFASKFNMMIALLLAYAITCGLNNTGLLSLYQIFSSQVMVLQLSLIFCVIGAVFITLEQIAKNRKQWRAAMTARRAPHLRQHMIDGVVSGSFAYLATQVAYGSDDSWLPPMAKVYVICDLDEIESDPTRERTMVVVPVFDDVSLERPSMAVEVPKKDLYKYIPRNMIPELL